MCTFAEDVAPALKKFRFRKAKNSAAITLKIDIKKMEIQLDEEMEDCDIEEVKEELPEFAPRYVFYSFCHKHADGRESFPMLMVYYCPGGVKPEQAMIYASTQPVVVKQSGVTKVYEIRDVEDFTEEWVNQKLGFFD